MADEQDKWVSPTTGGSPPDRRRVEELKKKFEELKNKPDEQGSGKVRGVEELRKKFEELKSKPDEQGSGKVRGVEELRKKFEELKSKSDEKGSGKVRGTTEYQESGSKPVDFSENLQSSEDVSYSEVLESSRIEGREGERHFGIADLTNIEDEKIPRFSASQKKPEPRPPYTGKTRKAKDYFLEEGGFNYRDWYFENMDRIYEYENIKLELLCMLSRYVEYDINVEDDYSSDELANMVKNFVEDLILKFKKFDIDLTEVKTSDIADKIYDHKRKVMETITFLEKQLQEEKQEVARLKQLNNEYWRDLHSAAEAIELLKASLAQSQRPDKERGVSAYYHEFMKQSQQKMRSITESLVEGYEHDIVRLTAENQQLRHELSAAARGRVDAEERCMRQVADASRGEELVASGIRDALVSVLGDDVDKKPNPDDARKVANKWKEHLNQAFGEIKAEYDSLRSKYENGEKQRVHLASKCTQLEEELEDLKFQIKTNTQTIKSHQERKQRLISESEKIAKEIAELENHYKSVNNGSAQYPIPSQKDTKREKGKSTSDFIRHLPYHEKPIFASQGHGKSFEYPSPGYFGYSSDGGRFDYVDDDYSVEYEPDPGAVITQQNYFERDSTPSSPDETTDSVFLPNDPKMTRSMREYIKSLVDRHRVPTYEQDKDFIDHFETEQSHNREHQYNEREYFDIPETQQWERAQSASPGGKKSYDSPYIPKPYFLSQGNYEADESFHFTLNSSLQKTLDISSPGRDEPLHLNIEVKPKQISESDSKEHVICDIDLNVKEVEQAIYEQEIMKVPNRRGIKKFERGKLPITPTIARDPKKGTPTGIFKKRHHGIRNLFDAELDDYRPPPVAGRSIEWETEPPLNYDNGYYRRAPQ